MNYKAFLDSLDKNKVHYLSDVIHSNLELPVTEPMYCVSSSGTESSKKNYLIKLSALLESAKIITSFYKLNESDRWLQSLATKHIGGFSINVRSYVASMKVPFEFKWAPEDLDRVIRTEGVTILSLVPAQVFDLVSLSLVCPKSIKAVFVGGGYLNQDVYKEALELGWPLKLCYGMTETSAQIAQSNDGSLYEPYPGWRIDTNGEGSLMVSGPGLYSFKEVDGAWVEFCDEWYVTGDSINLADSREGFELIGRRDGLLKQKGSFKDYKAIKENFEKIILKNQFKRSSFEFIVISDKRGESIGVIVSEVRDLSVMNIFKSLDIKGIYYVEKLPRTDLLKIKISELTKTLQKQILFY